MKLMSCLVVCAGLAMGQPAVELEMKAAAYKEEVKGDLKGAIEGYRKIANKHAANRPVAAEALLRMARCHEKLGGNEARKIYERIVKEYGDQGAAAQARAKLNVASGDGEMRVRQYAPAGTGCMPQAVGARWTDCHRPEGIFVRDLASGQERLVVAKSAALGRLFPGAFSPDEKTLTYFAMGGGLRAVGTDGSGDRLLARGRMWGTGSIPYVYGLWTKDGRHILAILAAEDSASKSMELVRVTVADGRQEVLRKLEVGPISDAVLSPDERTIALKNWAEDTILLAPVGGGEVVRLEGTGAARRLVGWHESGHLLYTSNQAGGAMGIWAIRVAQGKSVGEPVLIHKTIHPQVRPFLGNDGAVHFGDWSTLTQVQSARLDPAAGTLSQPVPATKLFSSGNWLGNYSRDGKRLVYATAYAPGTVQFVVQDLASGKEQAYPSPFPTVGNGEWFPDGSALLLQATVDRGVTWTWYRLSVETGESQKLFSANDASFSGDGKHIYYTVAKEGAVGRMDVATGESTEVMVAGVEGVIRNLALSRDGLRIACLWGQRERNTGVIRLTVAKLGGGGSRLVLEHPAAEWRYNPTMTWTADSKALLYNRPGKDGLQDLWMAGAEGGEPRRIYAGGNFMQIAVHPNGREVALSTRDTSTARFWVIENPFGRRREN